MKKLNGSDGRKSANRPLISRRKFLGFGSGALLGIPLSRALAGETGGLVLSSRSTQALGTRIKLSVLHADPGCSETALDKAISELDRVERLMSIYRQDSQLSVLNRDGSVENPDPLFVKVLGSAIAWARRSGGAFDPTVQPLWDLFRRAQQNGSAPDEQAIEVARSHVDWRQLHVSTCRIELNGEGTAVTLNGIAQGFAVDRVVEVLQEYGVGQGLIDCGEIGALGVNATGKPWSIGIQHPREPDSFISIAELDGRSMSTSGDYATAFSPDFRSNHIFDPRTGHSPGELASVTIVAPNATDADALSTAVAVLGVERGLALIESMDQTDGFLVLKQGRALVTKGFPCKA
jgi:FAD:protein FMN transferase